MLTGSPPFEAAERQELFRRIRAARYPLPPNLSPRARALIARLLVPEPTARPSLPDVLAHGFFTQVGGEWGPRPTWGLEGTGGHCFSLPRASHRPGCHPAPATRSPSSWDTTPCAGWCGGLRRAGEGVAVPGAPGLTAVSPETPVTPPART